MVELMTAETSFKNVSFKEMDHFESSFQSYYNEVIIPFLLPYEEKRRVAVRNYKIRFLISAVILVLLGFFGFLYRDYLIQHIHAEDKNSGEMIKLIFLAGFLVSIAVYYFVTVPLSAYKNNIKGEVFPKIFGYFKDTVYFPESRLDVRALNEASGLFGRSAAISEDHVKGSYAGTEFDISEVCLQVGGGKSKRTVFQGNYILLNTGKVVASRIIIRKDNGKLGNLFTRDIVDIFGGKKPERINFDHKEFEDNFEVYSTDALSARQLISLKFIDNLLELSKIYGRGSVQVSFFDDKILIALNTNKKSFEVGSVFKPCTFEEDVNNILAQMSQIYKVIDILKI